MDYEARQPGATYVQQLPGVIGTERGIGGREKSAAQQTRAGACKRKRTNAVPTLARSCLQMLLRSDAIDGTSSASAGSFAETRQPLKDRMR